MGARKNEKLSKNRNRGTFIKELRSIITLRESDAANHPALFFLILPSSLLLQSKVPTRIIGSFDSSLININLSDLSILSIQIR